MYCSRCGAPLTIPAAAYYTPGTYEAVCTRSRWFGRRHREPVTTGPFRPERAEIIDRLVVHEPDR